MKATLSFTLAAVVLGLALAAVRADPKSDPEERAAANLRSLGQATILYAQDNRGQLPSSVGLLFEHKYATDAAILLDPRLNAGAARPKDEAIANPDFRLAAPASGKMQVVQNLAAIPLWVSKAHPATGRLLVCFVDGHVESFQSEAVKAPTPMPSTQPLR